MLKPILTTISVIVALLMYYPMFKRILLRKSTGDYSKVTQSTVLGLQILNGTIAVLDHAWYNAGIYLLHAGLVGGATWLIFKYHDKN